MSLPESKQINQMWCTHVSNVLLVWATQYASNVDSFDDLAPLRLLFQDAQNVLQQEKWKLMSSSTLHCEYIFLWNHCPLIKLIFTLGTRMMGRMIGSIHGKEYLNKVSTCYEIKSGHIIAQRISLRFSLSSGLTSWVETKRCTLLP